MTFFYKRFVELCAKNRISPSAAANKIGLSRAAASGWKDGAIPADSTIFRIAELFKVPTDHFKEPAPQKENPTSQRTGEVDGAVTKELFDMVYAATEEERRDMLEILRIYKRKETKKG